MSSFIMSKSEVVVLFDLMAFPLIPIGIRGLPQLDEFEYRRIVNSFSANRLIDKTSETIKPNKGLEQFLLPVVTALKIMLFNYGINGTCSFNASLYFAKKGLVAVFDNGDGKIKFLTIDSIDDLLLFIPEVSGNVTTGKGVEPYISYILFDKMSSIIHCTRIDTENQIARIVEGKRTLDSVPLESESVTEITEYREKLHDKFKELYHVVSC